MIPFPSDQTFDRGARTNAPVYPSAPEHLLAPGVPVDSVRGGGVNPPSVAPSDTLCDACEVGICCWGQNPECSCACRNETDEEFVAHGEDEALAAMTAEGALPSVYELLNERYGYGTAHGQGWAV